MLADVISAELLDGYRIRFRFDDQVEGILDLAEILTFRGVFAPLRDIDYFRKLRVDKELGTVVWPHGADIDPDVLHSRLTGQPITLA